MRQLHSTSKEGIPPRAKKEEPLEEGIVVPTDSFGRRMLSRMDEVQIAAYSRQFMQENGITNRGRLQRKDKSLYECLRKRELLDRVFEGMEKYPKDPAELLAQARRYIEENGITGRGEFYEKENRLYDIIRKRNLMDDLFEGIPLKQRKYPEDPEELLKEARQFIRENGITGRKELVERGSALYQALQGRNLIDAAFEGMDPKRSTYPEDPEELVRHVRQHIKENGITGRKELAERANALYRVLQRRNLIDAAFEGMDPKRSTYPEDPEELVKQARQFINENGISGRGELQRMAGGLYGVLSGRELLDAAFEGMDPKRCAYPKDPGELVRQAKEFIREKGISSRGELQKKGKGLYLALIRRKLMDAVFAEFEAPRRDEARSKAVECVLEVLDEMGGSE